MIVWATNHDFWSTVISSPTSLRKNFDTMIGQKDKVKHPKSGQRLENTNSSEYDDLPI